MRVFAVILSAGTLCAALLPAPAAAQDQPDSAGHPLRQGEGRGEVAPSPGKPEGKITRQPTLKQFVEAPYPLAAFEAGVEGEVQLEIEVDEKGAVKSVTILKPAGHGFDEAAAEAAKKFRFEPAEIDGKPAPVKIVYRYKFTLEKQAVKKTGEPGGPTNFAGIVKEKGTRTPIPLANLSIEEADEKGNAVKGGRSFETAADEQGKFELRGVPAGRYKVSVMAADFYRFETVDEVSEGKITEVTYYVQRLSYNRFETVVRGKKEKKEVAKRTLEIEEIKKIPGTGGDAIRVVQNLPGVARTPLNTGGLIVRGSSWKDTLVFMDGVLMPTLFHFMGLTSVYNSDLLESLEFMPGGFSARYGDATAGAVELKSRKPKNDRYHGYLDVNLFETSAMVEGPITENTSFCGAVRRSYIDFILQKAVENVEGFDMTVAPWYYDYQAKYFYSKSRSDEYSVQAYGSDDEMRMVFSKPVEDANIRGQFALVSEFHRLTGTWLHRGKEGTSTLAISPGYTLMKMNIFEKFNISTYITDLLVREDVSTPISKNLTLNWGGQIYTGYYDFKGHTPRDPGEQNQTRPFQNYQIFNWGDTARVFTPAGYIEGEIKPHNRWKVIPGLRVSYYDWLDQLMADPRLAVWFKVDDDTNLKGQVGLYHTYPMIWYTVPGLGNPNLHAESAIQYNLGVERKLFEHVTADLQVFYKNMFDLAVRTEEMVERRGKMEPLIYNSEAVGRAYGAEVLLKHEMSKYFFGWFAYTIGRAERKDVPGGEWAPNLYDQTHILTLVGVFKLPANWDLGFRFRYVSGNPYTPMDQGGYFDSDFGNYWPLTGGFNKGRMPDFHQLDIRVDKKFVFDLWMLDVYLDVLNVYNHRSIEGVQNNFDFTKEDWVQGLPILPTIGVKAEF